MEHDDFLNGWLTGNTLTAWKTVRARVKSGVVISPGLGLEILDAMDKLAGDVTAAVGDRMRAEGEAQILAAWLANKELGISPTELRESARKEAQGEMEARHE